MAAVLTVLPSSSSPSAPLTGSEKLQLCPRLAPSISFYRLTHRRRNLKSSTRHSQFENSQGDEEPEGIGEAFFGGGDLADDESDEDETESSIDLLIRFLQSLFSKASKRAKKASRSILPPAISPQLVSFAVDGVLLLASLSILKALLEVVCTLGSSVFVAILLLRVIWAAVSYFQSDGNNFDRGQSSFGTT